MTAPDGWLTYLGVGVASGLLSGVFGVGAGIILIPALVALATPQKEAQGIALAVMVPMALFGAIRYRMHPEIGVDLGIAALIAAGALAGVWAGTSVAGAAWMSGTLLRRLFAVFMIVVAIRMLVTK